MHKLAPALIASFVALASGSALALGDRNKDKAARNDSAATYSSGTTATSPPAVTQGTTTGAAATSANQPSGTQASNSHSGNSGVMAGTSDAVTDAQRKDACKDLSKSDPKWIKHRCDMLASATGSSTGSGR